MSSQALDENPCILFRPRIYFYLLLYLFVLFESNTSVCLHNKSRFIVHSLIFLLFFFASLFVILKFQAKEILLSFKITFIHFMKRKISKRRKHWTIWNSYQNCFKKFSNTVYVPSIYCINVVDSYSEFLCYNGEFLLRFTEVNFLGKKVQLPWENLFGYPSRYSEI